MKLARTTAVLSAAATVTMLAGCGSAAPANESADASAYETVDAVYDAVNESAGCDPEAPAAPEMVIPPGDVIGESKMCTPTVMVSWFADGATLEKALDTLSPESQGGTRLSVAVGSNWTVADLTDVAVGASPSATQLDLEQVAEDLGGFMVDHD